MDKHYGWQSEGRGAQGPWRGQNGQRWNERNRDDDRETHGGGEYGGDGWDQGEGGAYGSRPGSQQWGSQGWNRGRESSTNRERMGRYGDGEFGLNRGQGGQSFGGGHYGGYANEGYPDQSAYGRGFTGQGSGEGFGGSGNWGGNRGFSSGYGSSGQNYSPNYGQTYGQRQGRGFSGRGPKGYQRSDERIKELLSDRLMDDDDIDASDITIEVKSGEVTLTGTVSSREEKRAAEDAADQTPGVREVQNHLRIQSRDQQGQLRAPAKSKTTERE